MRKAVWKRCGITGQFVSLLLTITQYLPVVITRNRKKKNNKQQKKKHVWKTAVFSSTARFFHDCLTKRNLGLYNSDNVKGNTTSECTRSWSLPWSRFRFIWGNLWSRFSLSQLFLTKKNHWGCDIFVEFWNIICKKQCIHLEERFSGLTG